MRQLALLASIFFVTACSLGPPQLKVGTQTITERDIERQQEVIKVYYPNYGGNLREAAVKRLIDSLTRLEVMKNNGWSLGDSEIEAEAARFDKESMMPEKLQAIKKVFGSDRAAYLKWFVAPILAERTLETGLYLKDRKVHARTFAEAEKFLNEARKAGKHFASLVVGGKPIVENYEVAERAGVYRGKIPLHRDQQKIFTRGGDVPMAIQDRLNSQGRVDSVEVAKRFISEVLVNLKPGDVYGAVIDHGREWWVVRLSAIRKMKVPVYSFEAAQFVKDDFVKWYDAEKIKVKITGP